MGEFVETRAIKIGSQVHNAIERELKGEEPKKVDGPLDVDELEKLFMKNVRPILGGLKPVTVEKFYYSMGGKKFTSRIDVISRTTPLFDPQTYAFTGKFEAKPCVADWKTTANPQRMLDRLGKVKRSKQLQAYCLVTGETRGLFVFLLPDSLVRGALADFTEKELEVARNYYNGIIDCWNLRWGQAHESALRSGAIASIVKDFDVSVFNLSGEGDGLCSKRWCPHWARCIGRKE